MVVRVAVTPGRRTDRAYRFLLLAPVLLAGIASLPTPTWSAGSSPTGLSNPAPPSALGRSPLGGTTQTQVFDPAAAALSSMLSYGAMSVIAPNIYGDFVSPTALSSTFDSNGAGPMPQATGLDPAISTTLDGIVEQGTLPGDGSAGTAQVGFGSSGAGVALSDVVAGFSGSPTVGGVGGIAKISAAEGVSPVCGGNQTAKQLQTGGEFWDSQGASATPVQFPQGVFTGSDAGNLGLAPSGNPSNLSAPGPGGGWCRPLPGPFSESSPLESRLFWIGGVLMLVVVAVFWLSRGMKMPTHSFGQRSLPVKRNERYGLTNDF